MPDTDTLPTAQEALKLAQEGVSLADDKDKALTALGFCIGALQGLEEMGEAHEVRATLNYLESRYGKASR